MLLIIQQAIVIAAKDIKVFFKDRFALAFALLFPFMFVVAFSLILSDVGPEDGKLTITVATQESQGVSLQIIAALQELPEAAIRVKAHGEALQAVENEELDGFLSFPADFTQDLVNGIPTEIEVVTGPDALGTQAALQGIARVIASRTTNTQTAARAIMELQTAAGADSVIGELPELRDLIAVENESIGDIEPFRAANFTLPGYLTMFVFFAAAIGAEAIAKERQNQTLERLMSNGMRRSSFIAGKYIAASYRGLLQIAIMWGAGILLFGINLGASPIAVILVSILMVLTSAGFGVMLAALMRTEKAASSAAVLASLTLAPIGGSWWPLFITPEWMQNLGKLTPHGWANTAFNKLLLFGADLGDIVMEMVVLALFGVAFMVVTLWRFKLSLAH
jgi:ABC-2 type transport system permease protein